MFDRFTGGARRVIISALDSARQCRHSLIDTEHLLLGIVSVGDMAAQVLYALGVSKEDVLKGVEAFVVQGESPSPDHIPFAPCAKNVLELAMRQALRLNSPHIGTEHLLLGLLEAGEGVARQVLIELGIDYDNVRRYLSGEEACTAQEPQVVPTELITAGARTLYGVTIIGISKRDYDAHTRQVKQLDRASAEYDLCVARLLEKAARQWRKAAREKRG